MGVSGAVAATVGLIRPLGIWGGLAGLFAGKPAPMYGLAPTVYPLSKKLPPCCIYVLGLFEEAVVGFWPKLEELVACRLQSGLEGQ